MKPQEQAQSAAKADPSLSQYECALRFKIVPVVFSKPTVSWHGIRPTETPHCADICLSYTIPD